jgi:hypothetical protein
MAHGLRRYRQTFSDSGLSGAGFLDSGFDVGWVHCGPPMLEPVRRICFGFAIERWTRFMDKIGSPSEQASDARAEIHAASSK